MSVERVSNSSLEREVPCTPGTPAAAAERAMLQLVQALAKSVARDLQSPKASRARGSMPLFSPSEVSWWIQLIALVMMILMFYRDALPR